MPIFPQELFESVIDELAAAVDLTAIPAKRDVVRTTLMSCALVSRSLVRPSQVKLFHVVDLDTITITRFSALLSTVPHIGAHVRTLRILTLSTPTAIDRILPALPMLQTLHILPTKRDPWGSYPVHMRMSFAATFASPTLRCIELADQIFKDAVELQLLLGSSMALTELGLQSVTFADTSRKTASGKARVVLVTLKLRFMEAPVIECMLDSFTAVDITHLKTLELIGTPVTDLLTANSTSLVDVQIKLYNEDLYSLGTPFPRDGAAVLHSLHLNAYRTSSIATMLANFGWLHYFKALKTLTLSIRSGNHPTDEDVWAYMDREWGRHGILEWVEVNIYGGCEGVDTKLREWLPCTNQRGILNIHTVTGNMF